MANAGFRISFFVVAWIVGSSAPAAAHPVPFSYVDVQMYSGRIELSVVAHTFDVANDLKIQPPEKLLDPETIGAQRDAITTLIRDRLQISADGAAVAWTWAAPEPVPDRQSVRIHARADLAQ